MTGPTSGLGWPGGAPASRSDVGLGWPAEIAQPATLSPGATRAPTSRAASRAPGPRAPSGASVQRALDPDRSTPLASVVERELEARLRADRREPLPAPARPRILVVANQKGGVGKTTTAVNVAAAMALHGLEVLVVDLDPQGNASTALDVEHTEGTPGVYEVLVDQRPLAEVLVPCPRINGLSVVPASIDLAGAEIELVGVEHRETRLRRAITAHLDADPGRDPAIDPAIDYVFIDCPPSLGLLTVNALVAADEMLIPIQCEYYALEGLGQLVRNVERVRAHLNPTLTLSMILLTMFDGRTRLSASVADEVRQHFGNAVLRTAIPRSVRLSEAPGYQQTVLTYDPYSAGALSYLEAAREIALRAAR